MDEDDIESPTIDSPVPSNNNTPARKAKAVEAAAAPAPSVDLLNEPNPGANDLLDMSNTIEMTTTSSAGKQTA